MDCAACGAPLAEGARFCAKCGSPVPGAEDAPGAPPAEDGNVLQSMVPTKNPKALIAYYLGVFSLIPCVGFLLGIAAVVLGIMGLRFARLNPTAKGGVHAWVGIVIGGLVSVAHVIVSVMIWLYSRK
jgi:hypothetical protein